jgi:methylamine---glutamate N-methyltransferase subunit C
VLRFGNCTCASDTLKSLKIKFLMGTEILPGMRESATFNRHAIHEIQRAAETGLYDIRGWGSKRRLPHFDDLVFLGASMSRYPLEGYRERCGTDVTVGGLHAKKTIHLRIPITIAGMSFGALSAEAKEALGRGASEMGTSTTTGDGGMTAEERSSSKILVYQYLPSRYGMNPDDLLKADAIEIVLGQGAKPGGGGMLLGRKISDRVAGIRTLPAGIDQRSACRHPDWTGPDDLAIKIEELREITDWEKPIYVKIAASHTYFDVQLAVKAGADVIVLDGMQGGTGATQEVFIEHVGIPTLPALRQAVEALTELGMHRKVQLIISGGIRTGADVAKALAMGADAVSIGTAALIALGCNSPKYEQDYQKLGTSAGFYDDYQDGDDPAGISTQDPELAKRLDPVVGGRRLANYLRVLTMETQTLARACGKSHVLNLEPEDMVALTVEAAAMAGVPLAGTNWVPGRGK